MKHQRRKMQTRNAHRPRIDQGVDDARRVKYNTTIQPRIPHSSDMWHMFHVGFATFNLKLLPKSNKHRWLYMYYMFCDFKFSNKMKTSVSLAVE